MPRFMFRTTVAIDAATLAEAHALMERQWATDMEWREIADHVAVYSPDPEPEDVQEDDGEPECNCPAQMVARGGFRSSCPACGYGRIVVNQQETG